MRLSTPVQNLAVAATDATMFSSRASSRGRHPWRRGFSDRPGSATDEFVSGNSHLNSVRDANNGFRQGQRGDFVNSGRFQRPPFRPRPPPSFGRQPPFRQQHPFRPPPKPLDFRNWEYAISQPPPESERFTVLSYNILADYLANDHRRELYFHIPPRIMNWEWRKRRLMIEFGLWSPDIMCLQEVDKFHELKEELKLRGYSGIWKMRTGNPVDGCAIFWRTIRFKLVHEECIEFNKLGLRDNVAQICVLESTNQTAAESGPAAFPTSLTGANKVVICNIHVLYNPNRGEIKFGQVRILLDKAHAVSKIWNGAPVVMCGDFNCTPKSPLYNFISEQKVDLSGLPRNRVSGQYSAEIHQRKQYNPNLGVGFDRAQFLENPSCSPSVDEKNFSFEQNDCLSVAHEQNQTNGYVNNASAVDNLSVSQNITSVADNSDKKFSDGDKEISESAVKEAPKDAIGTLNQNDGRYPADLRHNRIHESASGIASFREDIHSNVSESGYGGNSSGTVSHSSYVSSSESSGPNAYTDNPVAVSMPDESIGDSTDCRIPDLCKVIPSFLHNSHDTEVRVDKKPADTIVSDISSLKLVSETSFPDDVEIFPVISLESSSPESIVTEKKDNNLKLCQSAYQAKFSDVSITHVDPDVCQNVAHLSHTEPDEVMEKEASLGEECSRTFLSESSPAQDVFPREYKCGSQFVRPDSTEADESSEHATFQAEVQDDSFPSMASGPSNVKTITYDPSSFPSMECSSTFLSEPSPTQGVFPSDVKIGSQFVGPDSAEANESSEHATSQAEVQDDSFPSMDSGPSNVKTNTYDPSSWTPMEIETASGNADCTLLEHPLKLRSTYTEVEDYSGTRDSSGEPEVTSYNRRFQGTVDYIWCSEGLQTVKVLDTIPKHVLQWSGGFPTQKWGSDHIALVIQLAFTNGVGK